MTASTFSEYAQSPLLTPDETYTVELLVERVRDNFDETYWDDWMERNEARRNPNYKPSFSPDHVGPAEEYLKSLTWVSFQRMPDDERPVRDLNALQFVPLLEGLVLINNQIKDLKPLSFCSELKRLHLDKNPIRDLSPIAECENIEALSLEGCPITDFAPLEALPNLRELSISDNQIAAFKRLKRLPHVRKIEFGPNTFASFDGFPEMPELQVIRGANVKRLDGLQHFLKLQNLVSFSGRFESLEPLRQLRELTHVNIVGSRVKSLKPLAGLPALRELYISTDIAVLDLSPLESIASLHEVGIKCNYEEHAGLDKLKASLSPWDNEFRAAKPRHTPSLELQIVDRETFDIYDSTKKFNLNAADSNYGLLESELVWLDHQIEKVLADHFFTAEDYVIPVNWYGARSRTVVIYTEKAVAAFPKIVLGIQGILSNANQDWIIYLHTDEVQPEFVVWVYPSKIMVTHEYGGTVQKIIDANMDQTNRRTRA